MTKEKRPIGTAMEIEQKTTDFKALCDASSNWIELKWIE